MSKTLLKIVVCTSIGYATIFRIPPNKLGRGIAFNQALSPRKPRSKYQQALPSSPPYIINIPINRPVTLNNLPRQNSCLFAKLEDGAPQGAALIDLTLPIQLIGMFVRKKFPRP